MGILCPAACCLVSLLSSLPFVCFLPASALASLLRCLISVCNLCLFSPFSFLSFHLERPDDVILWSLVATSVQGIRGQHRLVRESDAKALKSAHAASPSMLEA